MLSIYKDFYNTTAVVEEKGELFEILDDLFNGFSFDKKTDGFLICPSTFNGTRGLDNYISSTSIGLDIDSGMTVGEATDKIRLMGFGAYIYTTPSSRSFDRFRIFIKFNRPVTSVEDFRDIWLVLNTAFDGSVDIATQHAACVFFTPAKYRGANNYAVTIEGTDIDVELFIRAGRLLRAASRPKPNTPPKYAKQGICKTRSNNGPQKRSHNVIVAE